jgi:conjugal transfer pilus assembly protein TraL
MQRVQIPRHVDAPQRFLFWTVDQAIPFAVCVGIGIVMKMLLMAMIAGLVVVWQLNRYRDSRPDGYMRHLMWWNGLVKPTEGRKYVGGFVGPKKMVRSVMNPFARRVFPA